MPRLDALPRGFRWTAAVLVLNAWLLLLPASAMPWTMLPGRSAPDLPGAFAMWWMLFEHGFAHTTHARDNMYPAIHDQFTAHGFPLDAVLGWPLRWLFGYTAAFTLSVWAYLSAGGLSMAWLCARWWKSGAAGLAGGIAYQTASIFLREVCDGRPTHILGAAFVPVIIGLALDATDRGIGQGRHRTELAALGCGAAAACCALAYWYYGAFVLGILVSIAAGAAMERRPVLRPGIGIVLGGLALAGLPTAYTVLAADGHIGADIGLMDTFNLDGDNPNVLPLRLLDMIEGHDLSSTEGALRPALVLLALWGLRAPRRRLALPLVWTLAAALFAMGPVIQFPEGVGPSFALPGPFAAFSSLPLLRRFWWPDRVLFVAAAGTSLLVAGGMAALAARSRRWARWAVVGLLTEMWLASEYLPIETTDLRSADLPGQLAAFRSGEGPLLVLPLSGADGHPALDFFLLQPLYGRPTVNGNMPPRTAVTPAAYDSLFAPTPKRGPLAGLYICETRDEPSPDPEGSAATWLRSIGVRNVYLHLANGYALRPGYVACAERLLGTGVRNGPFMDYALGGSDSP